MGEEVVVQREGVVEGCDACGLAGEEGEEVDGHDDGLVLVRGEDGSERGVEGLKLLEVAGNSVDISILCREEGGGLKSIALNDSLCLEIGTVFQLVDGDREKIETKTKFLPGKRGNQYIQREIRMDSLTAMDEVIKSKI